jgi:hypothetical protein
MALAQRYTSRSRPQGRRVGPRGPSRRDRRQRLTTGHKPPCASNAVGPTLARGLVTELPGLTELPALRTVARVCAARGLSSAWPRRRLALVPSPSQSGPATGFGVVARSVLGACDCLGVWVSEEPGHRPRSRRARAGQPEVDRTHRLPDGWPRDERPTPLECKSVDRARSALLRVRGLSGPMIANRTSRRPYCLGASHVHRKQPRASHWETRCPPIVDRCSATPYPGPCVDVPNRAVAPGV